MSRFPRSRRERRCLVDSSAHLALINGNDRNHATATAVASRMAIERLNPYTTNAVVLESHALVLRRLGRDAARLFLLQIEASSTVVIRVRKSDEDRAREIIFQYTDKDFSYVDALSFAVMERLDIRYAFTFDADFAQYGFTPLTA